MAKQLSSRPEAFDPENMNNRQQTVQASFAFNQPAMNVPPQMGFPLVAQPVQESSLIGDLYPGQQTGQAPVNGYRPSQPFKEDSGISALAMEPAEHAVPQQFSSIHYEGDLGLIDASNLIHTNMVRVEAISHYGPISTGSHGPIAPNAWGDVHLLDQQPSFDIILPNQRGGKRGPFKDPTLREQTAKTRKIGSCIRCRMQRIRVSKQWLSCRCSRSSG